MQLMGECDQKMLEDLRVALALCTEELFQYDLDYINDTMGWPPSGFSALHAPAAPQVRGPAPAPS